METITSFFATQGILGIVILMLIGVVIYLARDGKGKEKELKELQDKRLMDSNTYTESFTNVAKEMVAANRDAVNSTAILQKSIDTISQILQQIVHDKK